MRRERKQCSGVGRKEMMQMKKEKKRKGRKAGSIAKGN